MKAHRITDQYTSGLISRKEARDALTMLEKQSQFNADYSDHADSYTRWSNESDAAFRALKTLDKVVPINNTFGGLI